MSIQALALVWLCDEIRMAYHTVADVFVEMVRVQ